MDNIVGDHFSTYKDSSGKPIYGMTHSCVNPYQTTIGRMFDIKIIDKELKILFSKIERQDIQYGIKSYNTPIYVLLGKEEEKDIPSIAYPIYFVDFLNRKNIVVDLREFVNKDKLKSKNPKNINEMFEVMTRKEYTYFQLRTAIIMDYLENGVEGKLIDLYDDYINSYTNIFYRMLSRIGEFPMTAYMDIKIVCGIFCYILLSDTRLTDVKDPAGEVRALAKKLNLPNHLVEYLQDAFGNLSISAHGQVEENYKLLRVFFNFFQEEQNKQLGYSNLVREDLFYQRNNNIWFGIGTRPSPLMALENIPLYLSIIETSMVVNTFKKSIFATMVKDIKGVRMQNFVEKIQRKFSLV